MSIEENKAVVRRYYKLFNQKNFEACSQLIAPGFVSHRTTGDVSREDVVNGPEMLFAAFPDLKLTIELMVAEGDKVAFREIGKGTHKGEFMGIAPTGNKIDMINTCILRIADGKWAEAWPTMDEFRLMQQLGVIPKP